MIIRVEFYIPPPDTRIRITQSRMERDHGVYGRNLKDPREEGEKVKWRKESPRLSFFWQSKLFERKLSESECLCVYAVVVGLYFFYISRYPSQQGSDDD